MTKKIMLECFDYATDCHAIYCDLIWADNVTLDSVILIIVVLEIANQYKKIIYTNKWKKDLLKNSPGLLTSLKEYFIYKCS